jgi:hypothetical protein
MKTIETIMLVIVLVAVMFIPQFAFGEDGARIVLDDIKRYCLIHNFERNDQLKCEIDILEASSNFLEKYKGDLNRMILKKIEAKTNNTIPMYTPQEKLIIKCYRKHKVEGYRFTDCTKAMQCIENKEIKEPVY